MKTGSHRAGREKPMKALKNESGIYTDKIITAITDCYQSNAEPSDAKLMELYSFIGRCICEQGEKAFVVYLAETLAEQLPQIKGFSPRNLRRMRDFYRTYENSPLLMKQAQTLNWTQNTVILECCETNEQRAFYIRLAAEQKLSKLMLLKAIEGDAFAASTTETAAKSVQTAAAPVCDFAQTEAVDTTDSDKPPCGAFVPACEPSRQGSGMPIGSYAIVRVVTSAQHQPINTKTTASIFIERLTDRGKPPDKSRSHIPLGKKKNAPPNGRTLHQLRNQMLCSPPTAA